MTTAISVENLGKRYRIGHEVKRAATKREALTNATLAPFRYLKWRLSPMTEESAPVKRYSSGMQMRLNSVL